MIGALSLRARDFLVIRLLLTIEMQRILYTTLASRLIINANDLINQSRPIKFKNMTVH